MAEYRDHRDWNGEWEGSYDGRPAYARISTNVDSSGRRARLEITYHEGDNEWVSDGGDEFDADNHDVRTQWLRPSHGASGRQRLEWPRLLLHTWDTNFISGISRWEGKDYGLWLRRRGTQGPTYLESRRFTSWYNVDGAGDHLHEFRINWSGRPVQQQCMGDGRPVTVAIRVSPYGLNPQNDVELAFSFIDLGGRWWFGSKVTRPWEFWVNDIELDPYVDGVHPPGEGRIHWPRFYLHTWDVRQASGWSHWEGKDYGLLFHNGSIGWT